MTATPPKTLPEQCEAASGGSRELDEAIQAMLAGAEIEWSDVRKCNFYHRDGSWVSIGPIQPFTTSIDAAMSLMPEGCHTHLALEDRHSHSWRWELRGGFGFKASARAATPALALCAAALRARESHAREPLTEEGN